MEHITIKDYFSNYQQTLIVDVRSPGEYSKGHIPGALNLPLFSDEERKKVGTTYKQNSPKIALYQGLDIVGPKMSYFLKRINKTGHSNIIVHCWRGGKRSQSMAWLLEFAGFKVKYLLGGYKAFRNFIQDEIFKRPLYLILLGGRTGMGKTNILQELQNNGEQIIDLEGIARHKGSAFGHLGETPQPTNEHFENELGLKILSLNTSQCVWVENESRTIGINAIPLSFWLLMKKAPLLNIEVSKELRLKNILKDYGQYSTIELSYAFKKIEKKIGGHNLKVALNALEENNLIEAIDIAINYYDKTYDYNLTINKSPIKHFLHLSGNDNNEFSSQIIDYANRYIQRSKTDPI